MGALTQSVAFDSSATYLSASVAASASLPDSLFFPLPPYITRYLSLIHLIDHTLAYTGPYKMAGVDHKGFRADLKKPYNAAPGGPLYMLTVGTAYGNGPRGMLIKQSVTGSATGPWTEKVDEHSDTEPATDPASERASEPASQPASERASQ